MRRPTLGEALRGDRHELGVQECHELFASGGTGSRYALYCWVLYCEPRRLQVAPMNGRRRELVSALCLRPFIIQRAFSRCYAQAREVTTGRGGTKPMTRREVVGCPSASRLHRLMLRQQRQYQPPPHLTPCALAAPASHRAPACVGRLAIAIQIQRRNPSLPPSLGRRAGRRARGAVRLGALHRPPVAPYGLRLRALPD